MSDEPQKEIPQDPQVPDFSKPAPSLWDTFAKGRMDAPHDIKKEVEEEFSGLSMELDTDLTKVGEKLGGAYFNVFQQLRDKEKGDIGVYFESLDRSLDIIGDGRGSDYDLGDTTPEVWVPDRIEVTSGSTRGIDNKNEKIHNKTFRDRVLPEYFLDDDGEVRRIINTYVYDKLNKTWTKHEDLIVISLRSYIHAGTFDIDELPKFTNDLVKELLNEASVKSKGIPLREEDYEQLQTLLLEIRTGALEHRSSDF